MMGILIAGVISLPDETGKDLMVDYMNRLSDKARTSIDDNIRLSFLHKALSFMKMVPRKQLPGNEDETLKTTLTIDTNEITYDLTIDLVKTLGVQPIYELRIDLNKPHWCFRATFFPKYNDEQLYYCFVHPFEKIAGYDNPTNAFRNKTYRVFNDLKFDQAKYAHYFTNE